MTDSSSKAPRNILFVCHSNVCRSPMAEYLFNDMIAKDPDLNKIGIKASSAGILPKNKYPPSDQAIMVMQERGLGIISRHLSREINAQIIENSDLILTMDEEERADISARFPEASTQTFMLSEFAGNTGEIDDPSGGSTEKFQLCANIMEGYLQTIISRIKNTLP